MTGRLAILIGAILGASGVALGAYHAHGLGDYLAAQQIDADQLVKRLADAGTAARYQLTHAVALVGLGAISVSGCRSKCLAACVILFTLGVLFFSGGLYLYSFTGQLGHPAIIPSGGALLIAAWLALVVHAAFCWNRPPPASSSK